MTTERTFTPLAGQIENGQAAQWPRLNYVRLGTQLDLICYKSVSHTSDLETQLTLAEVAQAGVYKLLAGLKTAENNVGGGSGLVIPANVFPGIIVTANGGAENVAAWLTSTVTIAEDQTGPWVTLTSADLQSRVSAQEYNLFASALLMTGQADPVPQILQSVSNLVRGYAPGTLGAEGSIPKQVVDPALIIAKQRFFFRVTALKSFGEAMKEDVAAAMTQLRDMAKGVLKISEPTTVAEEVTQSTGASVEIVNQPTDRASRGKTEGL